MLGARKTELVYASMDITKIHMLSIMLALVIVGHTDHNLY